MFLGRAPDGQSGTGSGLSGGEQHLPACLSVTQCDLQEKQPAFNAGLPHK